MLFRSIAVSRALCSVVPFCPTRTLRARCLSSSSLIITCFMLALYHAIFHRIHHRIPKRRRSAWLLLLPARPMPVPLAARRDCGIRCKQGGSSTILGLGNHKARLWQLQISFPCVNTPLRLIFPRRVLCNDWSAQKRGSIRPAVRARRLWHRVRGQRRWP